MKVLLNWFGVAIVAFFSTYVAEGADFQNTKDQQFYDQFVASKVRKYYAPANRPSAKKGQMMAAAAHVPEFNGFAGFGSVENAINLYAIPNSRDIYAAIYQHTPAGIETVAAFVAPINFGTKEEIDVYARQVVKDLAPETLTNSDVDKEKEFKIFIFTMRWSDLLSGDVVSLYLSTGFHLDKSSAGTYSVPAQLLQGESLRLHESMLFEIPNLVWGRLYVTNNPSVNPIGLTLLLETGRYEQEGQNEININLGYIKVDTGIATGSNSRYSLKAWTMMREGTHLPLRMYDTLGALIPEPPLTLVTSLSGGNAIVRLTGGYPGCWVQLQKSSDLCNPSLWSTSGTDQSIPLDGNPLEFAGGPIGTSSFFRAACVEGRIPKGP